MSGFQDKLKRVRAEAEAHRDRDARREENQRRAAADRAAEVDRVADELEAHASELLKQFTREFVEFQFDAFSQEGRRLRVYWFDPGSDARGRPRRFLNQLSFRIRRYHEYADVEVCCKMVVRDAERRRRVLEVDVFDQDPEQLKGFVEQQIIDFAALYSQDWDG